MLRKAGVLASFVLLALSRPSLAITTTNLDSTTPQQLAQLLAGPGVTVSNVTFTGANVAGGTFSGGLADGLGIESGVMLSSGDIANGVGPNDQDGAGTCNDTAGDADLDAILNKQGATHDAAVLEFDFVPATSTVSFRYVFASEEYNEFVGSINDIFAFFIDGQNVALVPGTSTPVSINTVNLDTNSSFYRNNERPKVGLAPFGTQFDGFTTVLTATQTLTAKVTHHIKLVIADNFDCILDSAVFLQAGSFVGQPALTISKTAPASVTSGTNLTYTITYGNTGNTNATGVVIKDTLPAGTSFVSATNGGQLSSGVVTWNVGTVNAGVTGQTVSFTVNVNATSGSVTNSTYSIEAAGTSPVSGSPVSTTVLPAGCPTITVFPATLPNGTLAVPYNRTITASGGTAPRFFSVTAGSPPPGVFLSSSGVLSGTPTAEGTFSFVVRATDANECSGSRSYTISITGGGSCETLTVSPSSLSEGFVGVPYSGTISGSGGTPPYGVALTSGSLPPGLGLAGDFFSGTPTAPGTFRFQITVTDVNECTASQDYVVTISCPPVALSPAVLPPASQGVAYNQAITVLSGVPGQYTFSVTPGLPPGLTLSPAGVLSGVPGSTGSFAFTVTATDAFGCVTSHPYTLGVCAALAVSPTALAPATIGASYGQTLSASGGTAPYGFVVTNGAVPPGLTLSPAGLLSGTPTTAGSFTFTVTATDSNGCTGAMTYTLAPCAVLAITPASLPNGSIGVAYSETLTVIGGTAPYAFAAPGSLPPGLALSSAGTLSGTPTQSGDFGFTVTATDANGCSNSQVYVVRVTDSPPTITSLRLTPGADEGFTLTVIGTGFVDGGTIFVNGVAYQATFVSPTMVTAALPDEAIPPNGSITVTVTNPGPTGATSNPASLTFCIAPLAPVDARIEPFGNPTGPLTATDFLVVRWQPPPVGPAPESYEFRINGDPYTTVVGTSAIVPPRGSDDPITLFVRAKCNEQVTGPEISSPTYSLSPPVADFTFSVARVGNPVTFTDTSSPQATSWLWIFDDGGISTLQSPAHTFSTAGTHRVALIASNGSGSSQIIKDVPVSTATSGTGAVMASVRRFETSDGSRWKLSGVFLSRVRPVWLQISAVEAEEAEEAIVYLRLLDSDGQLILERRLSVAGGESAINDVAAYGLDGLYTLELVSSQRIQATLRQPFDLAPKRSN